MVGNTSSPLKMRDRFVNQSDIFALKPVQALPSKNVKVDHKKELYEEYIFKREKQAKL